MCVCVGGVRNRIKVMTIVEDAGTTNVREARLGLPCLVLPWGCVVLPLCCLMFVCTCLTIPSSVCNVARKMLSDTRVYSFSHAFFENVQSFPWRAETLGSGVTEGYGNGYG